MESDRSSAPLHQVVGQLRELLTKATPSPWVGDRRDGSVKYCILGGIDRVCVCRGDNGNSEHGPYGFENSDDEQLVMAMRNALPALLDIAEAAAAVVAIDADPDGSVDANGVAIDRLSHALSLLPNAKDHRADAQKESHDH
jgi:hypothetical protein